MDAETLRLLITAGTGIVAGLGGAGLTAAINRKNTKDTLSFARATSDERWTRTQEKEHATWLRDKKQEAYADFLGITESIINDLNSWPKLKQPKQSVDDLRLKRGTIKIVGSADVRDAAVRIEVGLWLVMQIQEIINAMDTRTESEAEPDPDPDAPTREGWVINRHIQKAEVSEDLIKLVVAIRKELGTAASDDDIIEAKNLANFESLKARTKFLNVPEEFA